MFQDSVRVNCVCPLFLNSKRMREVLERNAAVAYQLRRYGYADKDEVANAFMMCIDDQTKNGEVVSAQTPPRLIQI